jgi:hypothetical protein
MTGHWLVLLLARFPATKRRSLLDPARSLENLRPMSTLAQPGAAPGSPTTRQTTGQPLDSWRFDNLEQQILTGGMSGGAHRQPRGRLPQLVDAQERLVEVKLGLGVVLLSWWWGVCVCVCPMMHPSFQEFPNFLTPLTQHISNLPSLCFLRIPYPLFIKCIIPPLPLRSRLLPFSLRLVATSTPSDLVLHFVRYR